MKVRKRLNSFKALQYTGANERDILDVIRSYPRFERSMIQTIYSENRHTGNKGVLTRYIRVGPDAQILFQIEYGQYFVWTDDFKVFDVYHPEVFEETFEEDRTADLTKDLSD